MQPGVIAQRTGIYPEAVECQAAKTQRMRRGAIVVEQVVRGMHTDDHVRGEGLDLLLQPLGLDFRAGALAGIAARITAGAVLPVSVSVLFPVGCGKVPVEVDALQIAACRWPLVEAIRIGQGNDAPVVAPRRCFVNPVEPAEDDRDRGQLVAVNAADHQNTRGFAVGCALLRCGCNILPDEGALAAGALGSDLEIAFAAVAGVNTAQAFAEIVAPGVERVRCGGRGCPGGLRSE